MFAEAYSKSITTSCLWWFWGRRRGDGGGLLEEAEGEGEGGIMRRILPYWVWVVVLVW